MRFVTEKSVPLSAERAWSVFSDTDQMNRYVGLPRVVSGALGDDRISRSATGNYWGLKISWTELPFEWIEGKNFSITRIYGRGPVTKVVGGLEVLPDGDNKNSSILRFRADLTPRAIGWRVITYLIGMNTMRGFGRYVAEYLARAAASDLILPCGPAKPSHPIDTARLAS